jgi:hypothetical protein
MPKNKDITTATHEIIPADDETAAAIDAAGGVDNVILSVDPVADPVTDPVTDPVVADPNSAPCPQPRLACPRVRVYHGVLNGGHWYECAVCGNGVVGPKPTLAPPTE